MNMKICILLILSLLSVSINTVAVTDCSAANTNDLTITAGTTTDTATWDKVADCVAAIQGSGANAITNLDIIINTDVSGTATKAINFGSARFAANIEITITISGSGMTQANLSTYLYAALETSKATIGNIILTIDTAPLIADLVLIEGWIGSKLDASSSITIAGQACQVSNQAALDACLVKTADAAAVTACSATDLIFIELNLTSSTPADVNACLTAVDVAAAGGKLKKLTINYTGVTTVAAGNVDFATLLTNRKALITDLTLNLKSTTYKLAPLVTGFATLANLTLDYSNNGLDASSTATLVTGLKTAGDVASTTFTVTMSDSATDNNNFGNLTNLVPLTTASASTTTVNVFDRDANCAFTSSNINASCSIVVITPTISDTTPMVCANETVDISSDLANAQNLNGDTIATTTPAWSLDTNIASWTLTATDTVSNLATTGVTEAAYVLSFSAASVSDGTNNIPVIYETVSFTVGPCVAEVDMFINGSAPVANKTYNNCADLVFTIDESSVTQGAQITANTVYAWQFKRSDQTTDQASADPKNTNTFTITKAELSTPGTYYVKLGITTPAITVEDQQIIIESCPATPHINGAVAKVSYTDCQDLVLSVGSYPDGVTVDAQTVYAWTLMKGSVNVLSTQIPAIVPTTATITVPKAALTVGDYSVTLGITSPTVRVEDFTVKITDGGECGKKTEPTTDSSNLLQVSLALVLVLASLL